MSSRSRRVIEAIEIVEMIAERDLALVRRCERRGMSTSAFIDFMTPVLLSSQLLRQRRHGKFGRNAYQQRSTHL